MKRPYLFLRRYLLSGISVLSVFVALPAYAATTLVVDNDGQGTAANCDAGGFAYSSIQAAVNAAAPGDTIFICPGTYPEQVVVTTRNLTIRGSGGGSTILRPTTVVANTTTLTTPVPVPVRPILLIDGVTGVTVEKLTIDGSGADSGTGLFNCGFTAHYLGVHYRNGSGRVDAVHITNMRSATVCGFGLRSESGAGGASSMIITSNLIDHYGDYGVVCGGLQTACIITGNTVRGEGRINDKIQAGIAVRSGANASISGNVITDHYYLPRGSIGSIAVGIFLANVNPDTNPHLLRDNLFANNELNVQRISTAEVID